MHWTKGIFYVKVFNLYAKSNQKFALASCFRHHENIKKRSYEQRVIEVEHRSFTPLVFGLPRWDGFDATFHFPYFDQQSYVSEVHDQATSSLDSPHPSIWPSANRMWLFNVYCIFVNTYNNSTCIVIFFCSICFNYLVLITVFFFIICNPHVSTNNDVTYFRSTVQLSKYLEGHTKSVIFIRVTHYQYRLVDIVYTSYIIGNEWIILKKQEYAYTKQGTSKQVHCFNHET